MVARTAAEPQGRPNKFTDVGVVGRKTGLMVKDTGRRDSAGLEDMDAFFSPTVEKSPRRGLSSPNTKLLSYRTKFQTSLQSEDSIPMSGTSSSIRDPKEVLASRKSLLAQHRTPQKTHLKSPAVRVQTPKASKLASPSRVRRMLFAELDTDFDDENLNVGKDDADTFESPTEIARPAAKRNGLVQQIPRKPVELEAEPEEPEEEDVEEQEGGMEEEQEEAQEEELLEEEPYHQVAGFGDDYDDDDGFGQQEEEFEDQLQEDSREDVVMEEEEEEEEDLYGPPPTPPPAKRSKARPKQTTKPAKKPSGKGRPPKQSSTQPTAKRSRTTSSAPQITQRKEIPQPADVSIMGGDVRRGTRIRVAPLAHWRGERIVYELEGRRASGPALPKIKEIVRIDTPPNPTRQHPRAQSRGPSRKRKSHHSDSESGEEEDAGEVYAPILRYGDGSTIGDYRIAVSKSAIDPQPLHGSSVRFQKLFQDGEYMASGIMDISVGGHKGIKPTKHSYMSFVVLSGKVEVKVHRTSFIMCKGDVFVVPRGNNYGIKNIGQKDCRLFFSQAVETGEPPEEEAEDS